MKLKSCLIAAIIILCFTSSAVALSSQAPCCTLNKYTAYELIEENWGTLKREANFKISDRAQFQILKVDNFGEGTQTVAKVVIYSKGFIYDITFTAIFGLLWGENNSYISKLLEVKEGKNLGLSDIAKQYLEGI